MSAISFEELDLLAGELLPERAVLSTMTPFGGGGEHGNGGNGGGSITSTCQAVNNPPLLGVLGGNSSLTCVPTTVS